MSESSQSVADLERKMDERHEQTQNRITELATQLGTGMADLRTLLLNQPRFNENEHSNGRNSGNNTNETHRNTYGTRISKVEFPRFDGKNVRDWLYKCDQFFMLDATAAASMVRLASIHLDGLALQWHLNYMRQKFDIYPTWQQYVTDVMARFGDAFEDPLSALLQIKHSRTIQEYIDAFELALTQLKHRRTQLMIMELDNDHDDDVELIQNPEHSQSATDNIANFENPQLSLQALTGISTYQTMRISGLHDKKVIQILLDSGSTHNFLDLEVAKKLGCVLEEIPPLPITGGGGHMLQAAFISRGFQWTLQQTKFTADVIVLPLVCCDLILGIQWLKSLGPILWDFEKLQMEFSTQGRRFVLRGSKTPNVKLINNKSFSQAVKKGAELCFMSLSNNSFSFTLPSCQLLHTQSEPKKVPEPISLLIHSFADIFEEPKKLPPTRIGFDHKIPLKEGTEPFNLRPYRYASMQKTIIDKLIDEMMIQGVIRHSTSPYASPTVLVRKKDGSWRLCVDFRKLNSLTIKDRFPIPLIEDLMDELGGASIFSKLDMKSGYHQLRMATGEEPKTAFKTHSGHFEYLVMPFGLTNAPASFQALMNHIFKPFLRKFVIVFFDDILVYSQSLSDHITHLELIFRTIREQNLFLNKAKCHFTTNKVEYLGHFITKEGVSTDPSKISAVSEWHLPTNLKQLRGFLGLAGYYRRFVKNFGKIAQPLTDMLKRDNFHWNDSSKFAFETLKQALASAPVLALPDFTKKFVVETDASGTGIGAVLMQEKHPIAYISKSLGPKHRAMSVYERELLAIIYAVQKWGAYLSHAPFIIKTDQKSIKHILDQKLNTPFQQTWVSKLMGFEFEIQYKEGSTNTAADALSRKTGADLLALLLDNAQTDLLHNIKQSWSSDPTLSQLISELQVKPSAHPKFSWINGELRRRGKLVIGNVSDLKDAIHQWLHNSAIGGHSGRDITTARVQSLFFWKGMRKDIQTFIRNCSTCQTCKSDYAASPGLLQPLPIPSQIWEDISMDFIEGLPPSAGKQTIFVVIDRLGKYAHFIPLGHPYTALDVAQAFLDHIFKLHGMPSTITSDRDPIFLSQFWTEFFKLQGTVLNRSTAYHPQTDGQTEIVNKALETYLRCVSSEKPKDWIKWLSMAEWWYNTSYHSATQTTPFEIVYGQPPPLHLPYLPGESSSPTVDRTLNAREDAINLMKFHLMRAQNRMKQQADLRRSDRVFDIGEFVFLKLQPYRQSSVRREAYHKLLPKYFGPFKILDKVGNVAYQLELPQHAAVHNVFHVSQLKKCYNPSSTMFQPITSIWPNVVAANRYPEAILDRKMVKRGRIAAT
ncbi:hypothetical protein TSUD_155090 [Trifolium subterraneum]|uniref:Reverse transcriptase n=1 Tax=Trifolium subterraneum TaxID=3900 RepID=A0A2Z6MND4_TRISU|nr:hypothetical protein TSUD_155090 [Trifolium subterraneum]